MKIDPRLEFALKALLLVLTTLAAGSAYKPSFVSLALAKDIQGMSGTAAAILSGVMLLLGSGTAPSLTVAGKVAGWVLAIVVGSSLLMLPGDAHAAPRHRVALDACQKLGDISTPCARRPSARRPVGRLPIPLPIPLNGGTTPNPVTDINKIIAEIQSVSLADLQGALADATNTKDTLASACYAPLISLVQEQQAVDVSKLPKVHVITTFQQARDLINALRPGAPIQVGCAPLANEVKLDVTTFIGQVAGGTVAIGGMAFGL